MFNIYYVVTECVLPLCNSHGGLGVEKQFPFPFCLKASTYSFHFHMI